MLAHLTPALPKLRPLPKWSALVKVPVVIDAEVVAVLLKVTVLPLATIELRNLAVVPLGVKETVLPVALPFEDMLTIPLEPE